MHNNPPAPAVEDLVVRHVWLAHVADLQSRLQVVVDAIPSDDTRRPVLTPEPSLGTIRHGVALEDCT
eukprot:749536-Hanusia_phi.AAC.3